MLSKEKLSNRGRGKRALAYILLIAVCVIIIYPLLWTIGASFNPGNSLVSTSIIPKNPTNEPQFSALTAIFVLGQMLGLINSHWLLILIYVGGQIPMNSYLLKGYMDTIPMDLDESARIDGASRTRIFWQIIIPLSRPMLAVVAMNGFTGPLGDFALSSVILRNPESYTLPIGLYKLVSDKMGASYTTFAAGAILISIPIVIIFLSLQKHFVSSLTAGGTKG